ncbi:hypothetical protein B9G98_04697 [Wickerhamiella sorbophila]|uniref:Uncharacterized protein n=1 Tax=Wickerhamiella sorbophila TaxID=45607 RepID=A0A2T0FQ37_9ASCO|nr:hypothetical protein B9G98_04697 [Wickerhamiella sorbophila]PRT57077.1 hypothetical protein B9G98_04697 [Wickerhamiella sorbophila]
MSSEIDEYRENLVQVKTLLEADPENEDLNLVKKELEELIATLEQTPPPAPEKDVKPFPIGSQVTSGKFKGRVISVKKGVYTIRSGTENREFAAKELSLVKAKPRKQTAADLQLEKSKSKWQQFRSQHRSARGSKRKQAHS